MTTGREVMQQALDALEYHREQTRPIQRTANAIAALRQALAQPVPDVAAVMGLVLVIACDASGDAHSARATEANYIAVKAAITALVQDRDEWADSTRTANTRFQQAERKLDAAKERIAELEHIAKVRT